MKERILEFLKRENKTSAQFAEEIGVQPSGISHILSGRNNPSLDFVVRMLEKYSFLSTDWLLFGKGSMYKEPKMGDLFDSVDLIGPEKSQEIDQKIKTASNVSARHDLQIDGRDSPETETEHSKVTKIVWFYEDKKFEEFFPRKD